MDLSNLLRSIKEKFEKSKRFNNILVDPEIAAILLADDRKNTISFPHPNSIWDTTVDKVDNIVTNNKQLSGNADSIANFLKDVGEGQVNLNIKSTNHGADACLNLGKIEIPHIDPNLGLYLTLLSNGEINVQKGIYRDSSRIPEQIKKYFELLNFYKIDKINYKPEMPKGRLPASNEKDYQSLKFDTLSKIDAITPFPDGTRLREKLLTAIYSDESSKKYSFHPGTEYTKYNLGELIKRMGDKKEEIQKLVEVNPEMNINNSRDDTYCPDLSSLINRISEKKDIKIKRVLVDVIDNPYRSDHPEIISTDVEMKYKGKDIHLNSTLNMPKLIFGPDDINPFTIQGVKEISVRKTDEFYSKLPMHKKDYFELQNFAINFITKGTP